MIFTEASKDEAHEILALYRSLVGEEFCPWNEEYPSMREIGSDLARRSLFVMKEDGRIIAAISLDDDEEVEALPFWSRELVPGGELSRVAVSKDFQNRGIARQLMKRAMDVMRSRGYKSMHFLVNRHNVKALRSYAHLNAAVVGECFLFGQPFFCCEIAL